MEEENLNDDFFRAAANVFNLRIPKTTALSFRKSFMSSLDSEETLKFIEGLDEKRNMTHSILFDKNDVESLERALVNLDEYIPLAFQLLDSVSKSHNEVTLDCQLYFTWRGSLCQDSEKRVECCDIIFEILMSLVTKACLHHRIGTLRVAADISRVPVGGQHMRICAGIMQKVDLLIKTWIPSSQTMKRPQELQPKTCNSMMHYFIGIAQKMAVIKALQKEGTAPGLLLKLCIEVSGCMSEALKEFVPSPEYSADFSASDFPVMIAFDRELFACLSLYFFAIDAYSKDQIGVSIAFCRLALDKLNVQSGNKYDCFKPGLPPLNLKGRNHLLPGIENLKNVINFRLKKFEHDNKLIFFEAIPVSPNLPTLPAGVRAMEPIPFDTPRDMKLIEFTYNPKRGTSISRGIGGIFGSMFENWEKTQTRLYGDSKNESVQGTVDVIENSAEVQRSADTLPVSRSATLSEEIRNIDAACDVRGAQQSNQAHTTLSDEEFARRLQQQMDMGQG